MDLAGYELAGLYDPADPAAEDRAALLGYLEAEGATLAEMQAAHANGRLFGLAGDRLARPGRDTYTWPEVAERLELPLDALMRAVRAYGLPVPPEDQQIASEADVAAFATYWALVGVVGEPSALALARATGGGLARIAEAGSQLARSSTTALQLATSGGELETAQAYAGISLLVPALAAQLDTFFRHHLEAARRHFEASDSADIAGLRQMRLGVGFADLSGFTGLSAQLSPAQLASLLEAFSAGASDIVSFFAGRVVKFLGDAVMFTAPSAAAAADIGFALVRAAPPELPAHVGLAYGTCLAMDGDYFGAPVNLAARLAAVAEPATVVAAGEIVEHLDRERWVIEELAAITLRGFPDPVPAVRLSLL